jgi:hypothetical protein
MSLLYKLNQKHSRILIEDVVSRFSKQRDLSFIGNIKALKIGPFISLDLMKKYIPVKYEAKLSELMTEINNWPPTAADNLLKVKSQPLPIEPSPIRQNLILPPIQEFQEHTERIMVSQPQLPSLETLGSKTFTMLYFFITRYPFRDGVKKSILCDISSLKGIERDFTNKFGAYKYLVDSNGKVIMKIKINSTISPIQTLLIVHQNNRNIFIEKGRPQYSQSKPWLKYYKLVCSLFLKCSSIQEYWIIFHNIVQYDIANMNSASEALHSICEGILKLYLGDDLYNSLHAKKGCEEYRIKLLKCHLVKELNKRKGEQYIL